MGNCFHKREVNEVAPLTIQPDPVPVKSQPASSPATPEPASVNVKPASSLTNKDATVVNAKPTSSSSNSEKLQDSLPAITDAPMINAVPASSPRSLEKFEKNVAAVQESKEMSQAKLPDGLRSAGINPETSFVKADHNLEPNIRKLFKNQEVLGSVNVKPASSPTNKDATAVNAKSSCPSSNPEKLQDSLPAITDAPTINAVPVSLLRSMKKLEENVAASQESEKMSQAKLPDGLRSVGINPEFSFVKADHNLEPTIMKLFKKEKVLGQSGFSQVAHLIRKADGEEFAVKIMKRRNKWNPILFKQEYEMLTQLNHPGIIRYKDCYMDKKYFYLCTELCRGRQLFELFKEIRKFTEVEAAEVIRSIIAPIAYCHEKNVVHTSLNPETIVYRTLEEKELVIINFSDARIIDDEEKYNDFFEELLLPAPECKESRLGWEVKKTDIYLIGVIAYILLTGRPPFYGRSNFEVVNKIIRGKVTFPSKSRLSACCKDFVKLLLHKDTSKRMSAKDALEHRWLNGGQATEKLEINYLKYISNVSKASKLKKVVVRMITNAMADKAHHTLKEQFDQMDTDGNGQVDLEELTEVIYKQGVIRTEAEARATAILAELDEDGDGKVDIQEWTNAKVAGKLGRDEKMLMVTFQAIDYDGDGYITHDELVTYFDGVLTEEHIAEMIKEVDENKDDKISFEEFRKTMKHGDIERTLASMFTQISDESLKGAGQEVSG